MEGLRTEQHELLRKRREEAFDLLLVASAAYSGAAHLRDLPEGRTLLAAPPEQLVPVAVSAAAAAVERRRLQQEAVESHGIVRFEAADSFPLEVIRAVGRRRLPYTAEDVELLLDLGTTTMRLDRVLGRSYESLSLGVSAARPFLEREPGSPAVLAALGRAGAALDALGLPDGGGRLRGRIRALVAGHAPGGLLDLSVLDERDGWAEPAGDVLRRHAAEWDDTQQLVALLAHASGTRPTKAWRRRSRALAASYSGYGELVRGLLEPLLWIELVPSGLARPPVWLLAPGNETLARGAVWTTADVGEPWAVGLLGRLALRGAAPSPHPGVTTALCHPVASGAIEALAAIGGPAARAELRKLLAEVRRRDLLRRIAAVLGESPEAILARDDRVRREKRRLVKLTADPEPKARQRAASAYVRRDLAPMLRAAGFGDSVGRTFWRDLADRVEVLHCKAHRRGLTLELGIWFRFVPRSYAAPERDGHPRPDQVHCDVRGRVHVGSEGLESAGRESALWFARWRPLDRVLRLLREGTQSDAAFGWGAPASPRHLLLTGYVAREVGDTELARGQLSLAAAYYRGELEEGEPHGAHERTPEWEAWVGVLEADAGRT
ncbi:MAG TPA: hypothetical protein VH305_09815 [Gaiella sp.]|jgi:hypothetical protein